MKIIYSIRTLTLLGIFMTILSCQSAESIIKTKAANAVNDKVLPHMLLFSDKSIFIPENTTDQNSIYISFTNGVVEILKGFNTNNFNISFAVVEHPESLILIKPSFNLSGDEIKAAKGLYLPVQTLGIPNHVKITATINGKHNEGELEIVTSNRSISIAPEVENKIIKPEDSAETLVITATSDLVDDNIPLLINGSDDSINIVSENNQQITTDAAHPQNTLRILYKIDNFSLITGSPNIMVQSPKIKSASYFPIIYTNQNLQILSQSNKIIEEIKDLSKVISAKVVSCSNQTVQVKLITQVNNFQQFFSINPDNIELSPMQAKPFEISISNVASMEALPLSTMITLSANNPDLEIKNLQLHNGQSKSTS